MSRSILDCLSAAGFSVANVALAAKVIREYVEDGIVSTDTLINAQNAGVQVDAVLEFAEEIYELTQMEDEEGSDSE